MEGGERNSGLPLRQEPHKVGSGYVSPHGNAEPAEAAANFERSELATNPGTRIQLSRRDGVQKRRGNVARRTLGRIESKSPVWQGKLQQAPMQASGSKAAHADETEAQAKAGEAASSAEGTACAG